MQRVAISLQEHYVKRELAKTYTNRNIQVSICFCKTYPLHRFFCNFCNSLFLRCLRDVLQLSLFLRQIDTWRFSGHVFATQNLTKRFKFNKIASR